jgi:hypothetical protein
VADGMQIQQIQQIQQLVTWYSFLLDDQDYPSMGRLFLEDAVVTFADVELHGRAQIIEGVARIQPTPPGKHLTGPSLVEMTGDERALAWTDMVSFVPGAAGGYRLGGMFRYHDVVLRTAGGWRFAARHMTMPGAAPHPDAPVLPTPGES